MSQEQITPLRVHMVGDDTKAAPTHLDDRTTTVVITAANPIQVVLNRDLTREYAVLQALDNQVVLCTSLEDAQQEFPVGAVLAVGIAIPAKGTNKMWVTAATVPSRVSVIAGYRVG